MGKCSDHKKLDELAVWDLDKGCRKIINQYTPRRRRLKDILRRQARKRIERDKREQADND